MWRWLKRGTAVFLLLLVVAVASGYWLLRDSLPVLEGQQALLGLHAAVTVARDADGTVTIDAHSEADALRALGYVHAQERYFEMDLMRRVAAGELSALVGDKALEVDKQHRLHRLRARVESQMRMIIGDKQPQLEAYVAGVNAGLGALHTRPWPYLLLRQTPQPWRAEDTPLAAFAMYFDLQGGENRNELALWKMQAHLPPALYALLIRDGNRWDAPLQGSLRGDAVLPGPEQLNLRTLPGDTGNRPTADATHTPGSNNFAVAGNLTADGRAIVADDMHLGLRAPNIWFRARLRYPDPRAPGGKVDVQGFTLPGLPLVVAGSNGHVAWGFTNSYIDTMDWKLETPCATPATTGCTPLRSYSERIDIAGRNPVTLPVKESAWGPVVQQQADGRVLSLRWVAQLPGAVNLGLMQLAKARDADDALRMAQDIALPTQNMLLADSKGHIVWRLLGPIPQRAATCPDPRTVIDARMHTCPPWPMSTRDNPILRSPEFPRLWTANARVVDGATLARIGDGGYTLGARAAQIRNELQRKQRFHERDLLAIQLDDRAVFLAPWQHLLQERANAAHTPALQALAHASAHWEGRAIPASVSYRIVRDWRLAVTARIVDGLVAPARSALGKDFETPDLPQAEGVVWPLVNQRPDHLLPRRYASWDALFEDAADDVRATLGKIGPLQQRTWGERNTAAICHPLAKAIPLIGKHWLCMPAQQLAGDGNMPRVVGPAFGASERMVVSPGHEHDGIIQMPGGQSGHPLSPFWGAGHRAWVTGSPTPFLPGSARYTLHLQPPPQ